MPPLEIRDSITIITGIVTVTGVVVSLRSALNELKSGQTEVLRQLGAIHKRLDHLSEKVTKAERDQAVLENEVKNLKESQRFNLDARRARLAAVAAGEVPMFREEGE